MHQLFLVHLFATIFMTGLIWLVQIVHYPLMDSVGVELFTDYEARHTQTISLVVLPMMLIELGTAILLVLSPSTYSMHWLWVGLILLLLIWLSTFFIQVPLHQQLSSSFDASAHRKLVNSNWIRTVFWTMRSGVLIYCLYVVLAHPVE
ncbi:MAG: hypothetical protein AAF599_10330 [Bacteroidota bacterium]